jgi:P4 family phage/plasmid primase-like protien
LTSPNPSEQQFNEGANFWHYDVGVPTIPGIFKTKRPLVPWEGYQQIPPTEEEHKEWLNQGKYSGGVMILCGTPCYRKDRQEQHLFLVGIDIDRQEGIDVFCTRNGKTASLQDDIGRQTLVEQHEDSPDRCHIFLYSPFKFLVKRPDEILGIEIKSSWDHGLMRVTPSVTEGGYPLRIIGTAKEPHILNELEANELLQHLNHICIDNGIEYLQKGSDTNNSSFLTQELKQVIKSQDVSFATKDKVKIPSGYRNVTLISVANSILFNHLDNDRTNEERLKDFFMAINSFLCKPEPLPNREAEAIWASALKWAWPRILNEILHGTRKGAKAMEQKKEEQQDILEKLIDELESKYHFKTLKDTSEIWYYKESKGIFVNNAEVVIRGRLESEFGIEFTNHDVSEFIGHIERRNFFDRSDFDPDIEWLSLKDCVINLKTQQTKPHSPDFLATVQVPVSYYYHEDNNNNNNPIIDFFEWIEDPLFVPGLWLCPNIVKFMHEVMAAEDVETVLDMIAYCLWRGFPFHKYALFNGSGRNGKGTMLALIKIFLGTRNVSGESLHRLLNNRFSTAKLYGKLANIHADISNEALKDTGMLKMLTGGDPIPAEEKFKPPFWFINTSKLLFSANEIPKTPDESDAFFARPIIINFPNQYLGDKADPNLLEKLTTDPELSGLLRIVLKRLPRVLEKGIGTIAAAGSEIIEQNYEKYMLSSDPIRAFIENCIEVDANGKEPKLDVHDSYLRFCNHYKLGVEQSQSLSRKLKGEFGWKDTQAADKRYHWTGIKLRHFAAAEEGQTTF